jgi:leucyl-tRNA synthetase
VKKVTADYENLQLNTAISQMMIFINDVYKAPTIPKDYLKGFVQLLSCVAPHLGEELWSILMETKLLAHAPWPAFDEKKLIKETLEMPIAVNGKVRTTVVFPLGLTEEIMIAQAQAEEHVQKHLLNMTIKKVIFVKGKMINFVVG